MGFLALEITVQYQRNPRDAIGQRFRDDEECLFPARPASTNEQPEKSIEPIQPWTRMPLLEHDELLMTGQVFDQKFLTLTQKAN